MKYVYGIFVIGVAVYTAVNYSMWWLLLLLLLQKADEWEL